MKTINNNINKLLIFYHTLLNFHKFNEIYGFSSMTNIKFQKVSPTFDCSKDKNVNKEIANWIQQGKQTLEKERTALEEIDTNTFSPIKIVSTPETLSTISNFDDASCASFSSTSKSNTNDFVHESLSARSSPTTINPSRFSPTASIGSTCTFKKPSYMKGKFNLNISTEKDGKKKESENDDFELSFVKLNKAVVEHLKSKKSDVQVQNNPDTLFCNLIRAELKQLDDNIKQIKKQEIMQILWKKENL